MAKLRYRRGIHGGKIYQNYVGKGDETSKGEHLLLSKLPWLHEHGVEVNWGLMWVIE